MKKCLASVLSKVAGFSEGQTFRKGSAIEILSHDMIETLRGGDKEYTPIYDSSQDSSWSSPIILLDCLK
ncbi:hypothetical protein SAMN04515674_10653 [Pseudarcicella hirudinis]|uniref:Uncharacterized protein n=1 Tax=Pseudarcicella hirudinis TaxID=1079859 RepID=A0A1I5TIM9_9BACT|nr:hypothetical protein [Pseudarcicella hirudinis]SFP82507.1 hypothetical protein SAMN04515674_10653 [Pseudarcicella hirudinis]